MGSRLFKAVPEDDVIKALTKQRRWSIVEVQIRGKGARSALFLWFIFSDRLDL